MEAVKSHTGFKTIEYVLVAAPAALYLSLYLLGSLWRVLGLPRILRLDLTLGRSLSVLIGRQVLRSTNEQHAQRK